MGTIKTTNIEPIADNGTVTLGSSGDTFTVPSGVTVAGAMANTPAFFALKSGTQGSVANTTDTKITYETEIFDTNSAFASSTFTVPSGEAGKYIIGASIRNNTNTNASAFQIFLHKNGSTFDNNYSLSSLINDSLNSASLNVIVDASVGDSFEVYCYQNSGGSLSILQSGTFFFGYKLIGI